MGLLTIHKKHNGSVSGVPRLRGRTLLLRPTFHENPDSSRALAEQLYEGIPVRRLTREEIAREYPPERIEQLLQQAKENAVWAQYQATGVDLVREEISQS